MFYFLFLCLNWIRFSFLIRRETGEGRKHSLEIKSRKVFLQNLQVAFTKIFLLNFIFRRFFYRRIIYEQEHTETYISYFSDFN